MEKPQVNETVRCWMFRSSERPLDFIDAETWELIFGESMPLEDTRRKDIRGLIVDTPRKDLDRWEAVRREYENLQEELAGIFR